MIPSPGRQHEAAFEAELSKRVSFSEWACSACQQIQIQARPQQFHSSAASIVNCEREYLNQEVIAYGITANLFEEFSLF